MGVGRSARHRWNLGELRQQYKWSQLLKQDRCQYQGMLESSCRGRGVESWDMGMGASESLHKVLASWQKCMCQGKDADILQYMHFQMLLHVRLGNHQLWC